MKLAKFQEEIEVNTLTELPTQLRSRRGVDFGSFWLWHESGAELAMMVNSNDAYLFFVSGDRNLMSQSRSPDSDAPDEEIKFFADNGEPTPVARYWTVPLFRAIVVIEEFFQSGRRSESIDWDEL